MNFNSIKDVERFLDSIPKFSEEGIKAADFSLERFKKFCAFMGNPQDDFSSIHVAGSNGKGSTCSIIASIYDEAGYKTGLYTSPHLMDYRERFMMNGEKIPESDLIVFFQQYASRFKSFRLTYFEISTAIAFWWFARSKVDIGVIETGLGGRLDATNVITPLASVITSVTLEHTDILGDTIEKIACEKGGIIKAGVPVVVGRLPKQAINTIKQIAGRNRCKMVYAEDLHPGGKAGTFQLTAGTKVIRLSTPFQAPVQAHNIAMAWQVAGVLSEKLPADEQQIRHGIENAGRYNQRGRFEKLLPEYNWYFDGAHNVEAIRAMKRSIQTIAETDEVILVLSLMKDKINKKMINELLDFKKIFYYTLTTKRGANLHDVVGWLPQIKPFPASQEARRNLMDKFNSELVIFGGSFYFYPTVNNWITTYMYNR